MEINQNLPDKRFSGRSKKMGLSAKPEFCEKLRRLSFEERRLQIEILEEAMELYERKKEFKKQLTSIYRLLGVNNSQEVKTFLTNKTLPQLISEIDNLTNKINFYYQTIQIIEKQMLDFQGEMSLTQLEWKMKGLTPTYFDKIGLATTYQVLRESFGECLRFLKLGEGR